MANIDHAALELRAMDEMAAMDSPIHHLHPIAKVLTTMVFIFTTASFRIYDLSGLFPMLLYPVCIFAFSGISVRSCFYKLRLMLPLVCAVGLFNPIFDRAIQFYIGNVPVTGGMISMVTLLLKGVLCLMASFALIATTSIDAICAALRKFHVPGVLVTLLLLTYRYISVMIDEVSVMVTAYKLRAPGQNGIHYSAWGSFLGQLLLRSMDRAEELYACMQLRGFAGEFRYADHRKMETRDMVYMVILILLILLVRMVPVAEMIGRIATGGIV